MFLFWAALSYRKAALSCFLSFPLEEYSMTQADLERQVSRATGESRRTIRRRGFSILPPGEQPLDDESQEAGPLMIDWDEQDAIRRSAA
jgi:hypothetical protein